MEEAGGAVCGGRWRLGEGGMGIRVRFRWGFIHGVGMEGV